MLIRFVRCLDLSESIILIMVDAVLLLQKGRYRQNFRSVHVFALSHRWQTYISRILVNFTFFCSRLHNIRHNENTLHCLFATEACDDTKNGDFFSGKEKSAFFLLFY